MWICGSDYFVSIVTDATDKRCLLVRARRREHLEAFLGDPGWITETPEADYPYRVTVVRADVIDAIASDLRNSRYQNFKASVRSSLLHDAYLQIWAYLRQRIDARNRPPATPDQETDQ